MRARLLPLLAVTALAAGVGVVIWHSMKPSPAEPPTVAAKPAEAASPSEAPKVEAASAPAPVTPKRVSDTDAKSGKHWWDGFVPGKKARIEQAKVEKAEEAKIAIDGVVVVVDSNGTEHREESGTLRPLFAWPPDDSTSTDDSPLRQGKHSRFRRGGSIGDEVPVEQGRFHAEVPPGRDFSVQTVTVGGRTAVVDSEPVKVAAGQVVTVRAHWIDGVRVHVVDKETRTELDDVAVVRSRSRSSWSMEEGDPGDPAERETVVEHGRSPVVVPPREQKFGLEMNGRIWVCARGHAWRALEIDYADLADRTVELVGAAELVVDVQGELPEPNPEVGRGDRKWGVLSPEGTVARDDSDRAPMLRLRKPVEAKSFDEAIEEALGRYDEAKPSDFPTGKKPTLAEFRQMLESMRDQFEASRSQGELVAERPARLGETRFEAIAAQELVVSVEVGASYRTPLVLGTARAKLATGSSTSVPVVVAKTETPAAARLAGTIRVPSGWDLGKLTLVIEPINLKGRSEADRKRLRSNEWTRAAAGGGLFHWDAGAVLPAKYSFKVQGAGIAKVEIVPPTGNENVEVVVPEAATLQVRVVDAVSGDAVQLETLAFMPTPEDLTPFDVDDIDLDYDARLRTYSARVPVGTGRLNSWNDNWMIDDESLLVDVHAGNQEVVARVHRRCGVVFELACAGTKVAWSEHQGLEIRLASADGKGRMDWMSERDSKPMLAVTAAGRYTVTVPAIEGYEPVAPFEIEIPAGEFVTRTIELKKAR